MMPGWYKTTIACLLLAATPASNAAPLRDAIRDGSHDMDFSLGRWTTEVTIIKDPFGHPNQQAHMTGTKVARTLWNGKAVIEEVAADGDGAHWQAATLFLYDPTAGQWSQNYVDSSIGRMEHPSIGGLIDGKLEFYEQEDIEGISMLVKGTWTIFSRDHHRYDVARSIDGGRSWHTSFIADVRRAQ